MSLNVALEIARSNPIIGLPQMAAVIYDRRSLISYGVNSRKTHPLQAKFGKHDQAICLHAEIAALANARQSVEGMVMYVARAYKDGSPGLAKPCKGCERALIEFGIADVEWTT